MKALSAVVLCALATLALRVLPLVINHAAPERVDTMSQDGQGHKKVRLIEVLPLAVLSALIVPSTITVDPTNTWVGIASTTTATVMTLLKKFSTASVVGATVVTAVAVHYMRIHLMRPDHDVIRVLGICGSERPRGNTDLLLEYAAERFASCHSIDIMRIIHLRDENIVGPCPDS